VFPAACPVNYKFLACGFALLEFSCAVAYNCMVIVTEILMQKYSPSLKLVGVLLFIAALTFLVFALTPNTLPVQ